MHFSQVFSSRQLPPAGLRLRTLLYGVVLPLVTACSAQGRKPAQVRMECLEYIDFDGCGQLYASMNACQRAVNDMLRGAWRFQERGNCIRNVAK